MSVISQQQAASEMLERRIPEAVEMERALIGALLQNREVMVALSHELKPEMFFLQKWGDAWQAALKLYERRETPDLSTLSHELKKMNSPLTMQELLSIEFWEGIWIYAEQYARAIRVAWRKRQLIDIGGRIAALGYDQRDEVDELVTIAEEHMLRLHAGAERTYRPIAAGLSEIWADQRRLLNGDGLDDESVSTGYVELDQIGQWKEGDFVILAARPGIGKSALAINISQRVSKASKRVAFFSLEMRMKEIATRVACAELGWTIDRLRQPMTEAELQMFSRLLGEVSEQKFYVDDSTTNSIADITSAAMRMHAELGGLDLVVVDYLQLIEVASERRGGTRAEEVAKISRGLKLLARRLRCPVLSLSQLSRKVEERDSKKPLLSDLRESGAIEQDADMVMFIHREEVYDPQTEKPGIAEIHIAKNRNGPTGAIALQYDPARHRFSSLERYQGVPGFGEE